MTHLGGHSGMTNTAPDVLEYCVARYQPIKTMMDLGCGPGGMLDLAGARGILPIGIDGDPSLDHPLIVRHDFTTGILIGRPSVDLVWCVEFVEHIAPCYLGNILTAMRAGRVLLLSHALPDQGGYHHVNEQPPAYWRAVLANDGWIEDHEGTNWLRDYADNQYIRRTGMLWLAARYH